MTEPPLYEKVRQAIASSISDGTYASGDRLPSEAKLAEDLGVNRLTVRRAIEELARAGLVQSRQGSGTYVSGPIVRLPVSQALSTDELVTSITEELHRHGYTYEDVLIKVSKAGSTKSNEELALTPGPLWRVDNAIVVNGEPWMWSSSWFARDLIDDPKANWSTVTGMYGQLNEALGDLSPIWRAITADAATADDARILNVRVGTPLIVRDGLTANAQGHAVLRVQRRARMDRVAYVLRYRD